MQTEVSILAAPGRSPRVSASGGIAVRQTGPYSLHLIGTAATPLGGDTIRIAIDVRPGARLEVRTVAAMIALPSAELPESESEWDLTIGASARLLLDPQPTVVAGGALHRSSTAVALEPGATVTVAEHAQIGRSPDLGRHDDRGGWAGALRVDLDGRPLLRHRMGAGALSPAATNHRGISSTFRYPDDRADEVDPIEFACRLALAAGGSLTTGLAESATAARRLCDNLDMRALTG